MNQHTSRYALFALLFLCFAGAILGDSTAEALLLANFKASLIPRMYLINAFFLFIASAFIMPVIDRVNRGVFFIGFTILHGIFLFVAWAAVLSGMTILYVPLFSYAYVSKIILFLLFWTLANDLTDSRSAGRDFPFIAAGGTMGAIGVSFTIPWLLGIVEAQHLLPIWAIISIVLGAACIPMVRHHAPAFRASKKAPNKSGIARIQSIKSDLKLLAQQPLLRTMSILYFLLFILLLSQQFDFYQVIRGRYDEAKDLAGFLGYFNGMSMAGTFLLQVIVSGRLIRTIGSTRAMFLLPAALCIVFSGLLIIGTVYDSSTHSIVLFWAVITGVAIRIAFFDSFFSPNFQVFFSSLPQDVRGRAKLAIEGAVKPAAIGVASLWLMIAPIYLPFSAMLIVYLGLAITMVILVFRLRNDYTRSLTQYLAGFSIHRGKGVLDITKLAGSENVYQALSEMLNTDNFETASVIVDVLAQMNNTESIRVLKDYLVDADPYIRSRIVSALTPLRKEETKPLFRSLLADEDYRVVANAILALAAFEERKINRGLGIFVNHQNNRVRANAIVALWESALPHAREHYFSTLEQMIKCDDERENASSLYILSKVYVGDRARALLEEFFRTSFDTLMQNRSMWQWYLKAAAHNIGENLLSLLETIIDSSSQLRRGDVARMYSHILAEEYPLSQYMQRVSNSKGMVREMYLQGLFLARRSGNLNENDIDVPSLVSVAQQEREEIFSAWQAIHVMRNTVDSATELLKCAVKEICIQRKIFTLQFIAAILDTTGQISTILHRLQHDNKHVRARALEVLDNTGNTKVNRWLLELLDTSEPRQVLRIAQSVPCLGFTTISSVVNHYSKQPNEWVRICANNVKENGEKQQI